MTKEQINIEENKVLELEKNLESAIKLFEKLGITNEEKASAYAEMKRLRPIVIAAEIAKWRIFNNANMPGYKALPVDRYGEIIPGYAESGKTYPAHDY